MAKSPLQIGVRVRILPHPAIPAPDREDVYVGKVGTLKEINSHNDDGDFYGVNFFDLAQATLDGIRSKDHTVFFWAEELEVIEQASTPESEREA